MRILAFWVAKEGMPSQISSFEFGVASPLGLRVEHIDVKSYDGERLANQYGVNSLPTIVALANSGLVLQTWHGYDMPTRDHLKYYIDRNQ
jgi:thioredoxin-related protein